MTFPGEEPTADNRQMAKAIRGMFVALVNEGFSENQALEIVGNVLRTAIQTGMK